MEGTSSVRLVSITPDAEKTIAYCARVSSPNQDNPEIAKLLAYCIKHRHWSIFEMANMCLEIETSRAIAQQILRHKSSSHQEFSQRYQGVSGFIIYEARRQDQKNRQNSVDDLDATTKIWFRDAQRDVWDLSKRLYDEAIEKGIAKECARFLLPLNTKTKLYMNASIRTWCHFLDLRCGNGTQLEHQEIAIKARNIFCEQLPTIAEALGWNEKEDE